MIEALKMALEALELSNVNHWWGSSSIEEAITAIKEALAQPEQEPVAWYYKEGLERGVSLKQETFKWIPLYTSPPAQRTWVGLTDEEIKEIANNSYSPYQSAVISFARAIEAAHGIKENT